MHLNKCQLVEKHFIHFANYKYVVYIVRNVFEQCLIFLFCCIKIYTEMLVKPPIKRSFIFSGAHNNSKANSFNSFGKF